MYLGAAALCPAKPSTVRHYGALLAKPGDAHRKKGARIMRTFGGRPLFGIATKDVRQFLSRLDHEDLSPRTVNIHRQVLHAIFEYARREETFGLAENPVARTTKRPEDEAAPVETFEPEEIRAIAAAARAGRHRHRTGFRHAVHSLETEREWQRINDQDPSLFVIAATTGLRLGGLGALRWRDVDLEAAHLTVSRWISAGEESSTKSRHSRVVSLAEQALRQPRDQALDLVTVKEMMGHSKLTTTERYLHSRPGPTDAATLTAIFSEGEEERRAA
jgi:integrase